LADTIDTNSFLDNHLGRRPMGARTATGLPSIVMVRLSPDATRSSKDLVEFRRSRDATSGMRQV
jgi:hypothetical protein